MNINQKIIELCNNRGWSIYELSLQSGITQSTLNNIISGRNATTTVSTIQKICDGLEIAILEFFKSPLFENLEQEIN